MAAENTVLIICPTHRDLRELERQTRGRTYEFIVHNYASSQLEQLTAEQPGVITPIGDPITEIESILQRYRFRRVGGVLSTDDYPGAALASIVARELMLPGVPPHVSLLCQHKFYCREAQLDAAPEAVPKFDLINRHALDPMRFRTFPFFVKPVKSFFSVGAQRVDNSSDFVKAVQLMPSEEFFTPFDILLREYSNLAPGTSRILAESLVSGQQCTLDGYVYRGEVVVLGCVDSVMFPGTIAFQRFEYPSRLPERIQQQMGDIARRVMLSIGYDNGMFNVEFMIDEQKQTVNIIEINPRMSSQFSDLFEKVDGTNSYGVLLDLACGRRPDILKRRGRYAFAASCVLRTFEDQRVLATPSTVEIADLMQRYPDLRIEICAQGGTDLSAQMQDSSSYRYGLINVGAENRAAALSLFEVCCQKLTFRFAPVFRTRDGVDGKRFSRAVNE